MYEDVNYNARYPLYSQHQMHEDMYFSAARALREVRANTVCLDARATRCACGVTAAFHNCSDRRHQIRTSSTSASICDYCILLYPTAKLSDRTWETSAYTINYLGEPSSQPSVRNGRDMDIHSGLYRNGGWPSAGIRRPSLLHCSQEVRIQLMLSLVQHAHCLQGFHRLLPRRLCHPVSL